MSVYMFFQFLATCINLCASIVFLIIFANDPFTIFYYFSYFLSMMLQNFPVCYYGSIMELEFENLTYAIFSSNWLDQDVKFKQNLKIIAEYTKKPLHIRAWLFHVNLNLFLKACKNSYSLFALIMNIK